MIATMLVLTHFVLRKLGLTNTDLPPGWPAYVCNTHEGGARTATSASVSSAATVVAATAASLAVTTAPPPAISTATQAKASVHPMQSIVQPLEPLAAAIPQPPPCIAIPNPPFPGSPCAPCPIKTYPTFEPAAEQKMPFVIDNQLPNQPAFGPRAGLSVAQANAAPGGGAPAGYPGANKAAPNDSNCVTVTASGVAVPCTPPGGKKLGATMSKVPPGSVAGGKSTLNQPSMGAPSKSGPPPK